MPLVLLLAFGGVMYFSGDAAQKAGDAAQKTGNSTVKVMAGAAVLGAGYWAYKKYGGK
ncbi:hypothetical protein [Photobacterium damselae]|uniref:hypothetical protein n=1 Tax=Photobacterium damselae TaxID=38293 RepID=UPI000A914047|nr:hypothetical protein [Photobacterium damselae]MCG9779486.1 hypothetical protein [Photobacterium damselae]